MLYEVITMNSRVVAIRVFKHFAIVPIADEQVKFFKLSREIGNKGELMCVVHVKHHERHLLQVFSAGMVTLAVGTGGEDLPYLFSFLPDKRLGFLQD